MTLKPVSTSAKGPVAAVVGFLAMFSAVSLNAAEFKLTASSSHPPVVPWVKTINLLARPYWGSIDHCAHFSRS